MENLFTFLWSSDIYKGYFKFLTRILKLKKKIPYERKRTGSWYKMKKMKKSTVFLNSGLPLGTSGHHFSSACPAKSGKMNPRSVLYYISKELNSFHQWTRKGIIFIFNGLLLFPLQTSEKITILNYLYVIYFTNHQYTTVQT